MTSLLTGSLPHPPPKLLGDLPGSTGGFALYGRDSSGWIRTSDLAIMSGGARCEAGLSAATRGGRVPANTQYRRTSVPPAFPPVTGLVFGRCSTGKRHGVGFRRGRGAGGWPKGVPATDATRARSRRGISGLSSRAPDVRTRAPACGARAYNPKLAGSNRARLQQKRYGSRPLRGDAPATACPDSPIAVGISGSLA